MICRALRLEVACQSINQFAGSFDGDAFNTSTYVLRRQKNMSSLKFADAAQEVQDSFKTVTDIFIDINS